MAEQSENSNTTCDLQGSFSIKKTKYTVNLTDTILAWKKGEGKKEEETKIPVMDIVSVKTAASKSSKTGPIDSWILCYAQRKKKHHLRKTTVVFIGETNDCQEWTNRIQQLLDALEQRPKHILVFINPISGWKSGEKNYKSKVAPLFAEANIYTDVKVTEKPHHPEEILATYDLSTIDSIVSVGGDGMYTEVVNGLMMRVTKDSNINLNDPEVDLPCVEFPIGLIPCGTGNGIADTNYGCMDVETAALSIIIGKRNITNIETVHCAGEFVMFSVLLVGCGVWGELIDKTEKRRNLGVFRYPIIMLNELLVKSPRAITYNLRYKVYRPEKNKQEHDQVTEGEKIIDTAEKGNKIERAEGEKMVGTEEKGDKAEGEKVVDTEAMGYKTEGSEGEKTVDTEEMGDKTEGAEGEKMVDTEEMGDKTEGAEGEKMVDKEEKGDKTEGAEGEKMVDKEEKGNRTEGAEGERMVGTEVKGDKAEGEKMVDTEAMGYKTEGSEGEKIVDTEEKGDKTEGAEGEKMVDKEEKGDKTEGAEGEKMVDKEEKGDKTEGAEGEKMVDKEGKGDKTEGAAKGTSDGEEWITVEKPYTGPMSFYMNIFGVGNMFDTMSLLASNHSTRMQMLKFLGCMLKKDFAAPLDFVDRISTSEYTMKVVNPSDPATPNGIGEHILDVDGEAVKLKRPEFTVRHFPRRLLLFANVSENDQFKSLRTPRED